MWKDVFDSLRLNWVSRTSSPLFGALGISWLVWNHRLLFVLFADKPVSWRFAYIDVHLYPDTWRFVAYNVVGPVASALFYLYVFPYPAREVFKFTLKKKRELNELANEIEGQRLLTVDEGQVLRRQIDEAAAQRAQLVESANDIEKTMKGANEALAKKLREAEAEVARARAEGITSRPDQAPARIREFLTSRPFILIFNLRVPREKGSKRMMFSRDGSIPMGSNENEHDWRVNAQGELEFTNHEGEVHSRFRFDPVKGQFDGKALLKHPQDQLLAPAPIEGA